MRNGLEEKVDSVEKRMEKLGSDVQKIYENQIDLKYVLDKLTGLEDRSRRNNLRIDGIKHCVISVRIRSYSGPYFPGFGLNNSKYGRFLCSKTDKKETWNDCEEKVQDKFVQKLVLDGIEIELAR